MSKNIAVDGSVLEKLKTASPIEVEIRFARFMPIFTGYTPWKPWCVHMLAGVELVNSAPFPFFLKDPQHRINGGEPIEGPPPSTDVECGLCPQCNPLP